MRGKRFFAGAFALASVLANAGSCFAGSIHTYDTSDVKIYGEDVIRVVRNTFKEELTNTNSAVLHDSTGDNELNVTLHPVYGITSGSDTVGVYYYDDDIVLSKAPLDESNADIVTSEAILKIVDHRLFDADETNTTDDNQSSIFVVDSYLDSGLSTHDVYSFMDAYRNYSSAFNSDNEVVHVETNTFKVTIPAHKKWGFYLTNIYPTTHTFYTDEEFNITASDYPERRYNQTADITVGDKKYTIFGMEDWQAINETSGTDEQCAALANDTERDPYQVVFNCMDANDIVFILDDDYTESEEPETPEEPKNPDTADISIINYIFTASAIAGVGLIGNRFTKRRG